MPIIVWNEALPIGIEQIDGHHQHLVNLLNTTYDLFVGNWYSTIEIARLIEELIDYATYHFSAEEQLMLRYDYVESGEHVKQHEGFIRQIKTFQQEFTGGRKTLTLELIVFLKEWLLEHISVSDRAYADAIGLKLERDDMRGIQIDLT